MRLRLSTKNQHSRDYRQLYTSIANIFGTDQAINKRQTALLSTTIVSTFDERKLVNFGPLAKIHTANLYSAKITTARAV